MKIAEDSETLTVSTTAVRLTAAKFTSDITSVEVYVEGQIRFWTSGKAPTSTDGIPMYDGTLLTLSVNEANRFKSIRLGSSDAKIHAQYFRSV